jgi:hypothetical protein
VLELGRRLDRIGLVVVFVADHDNDQAHGGG